MKSGTAATMRQKCDPQVRSVRCELWLEGPGAAVSSYENDRAAFVSGSLDLMTSLGRIGVDERRPLWVRRAFFKSKVNGFVHHLGSERAVAVGAHCLSHPSIISR
jgi:hypothetical protein